MSVIQPAMYKIEEETDERLVLRGKKIFHILGGAFLVIMGGIFVFASTTVNNKASAGAIALAILGMLILLAGIALVSVGTVKKNRIIFDQNVRVANFGVWPRSLQAIIPYDSIDSIDIEIIEKISHDSQRHRDERYVVYQVNIVEKSSNKRKIDESTNVDKMLKLATKVAQRCGVPFKGTTQ
jgi:hypothetical protein